MTPSLPTELLRTTFKYATDAGGDPCPAITDAETDWFAKIEKDNLDTMGTKIALTRVSRCFRRIALEFLFEFISFREPNHVVNLVEILKKQSSNGELVNREWIKFLFVKTESNTRLVAKLLHLCRGLRGFSWNPPTYGAAANQDEMIRNIPINIRFLHWRARLNQGNTFSDFLHKVSASLQILYISEVPTFQPPLLHLSFPSLTRLQVQDVYPFHCLGTWTMPSLIDLDLISPYSTSTHFPNVGAGLRVMRFGRSFRFLPSQLTYIFTSYPNLEEIYYYYYKFRHSYLWESDATHMKLKRVVVTINEMYENIHMDIDMARSELRNNFGSISKTRFPLLDTIIVQVVSNIPLPKGTGFLMTRLLDDFSSAEISMI